MENTMTRGRPWLVELVGPAGAGKTTLAQSFFELDPWRHVCLTLWGLPRRFLAASALSVLPTVAAAKRRGAPLRAREVAQMMRVTALRYAIDHAAKQGKTIILLDEGSVFGLTWLDVFFGPGTDPARTRWRQQEIAAWCQRLDAVVRLDAANTILVQRIRTREQPHPVKDDPDPEIHAFTAKFRAAFDRVLGEMTAAGGVQLLQLRTDGDGTANDVLRLRAALQEALDAQ
jgi:hypothetical protein